MNAKDDQYRDITIARLMGKLPTIAAFSYKKNIGHPFVYPRNDLEYCANFLHMMFAVPAEPYKLNEVAVRALNLLLILHADHEQNCSTSTVRIVGSAHTNLFASISAGICALWGPLHGGANQEVVEMLEDIREKGLNAKQFIDQVKDKKAGIRLMEDDPLFNAGRGAVFSAEGRNELDASIMDGATLRAGAGRQSACASA